MKKISLGRDRKSDEVQINMSPMVDMTFLLLIFFLVTTTFVRESGVEVNRPISSPDSTVEKDNILISVTKDGMIYLDDQIIDIRSVRSRMERFKSEMPEGNVIITADNESLFGVAIEVLDQVRLANIKNVVVASAKE
ncbi:MAG: biopolymer transporter ExbD [Deltaproteobacteria bacterium]|nr:biopolymer transporter ExbD [Deltaproteobacteria bacterium]